MLLLIDNNRRGIPCRNILKQILLAVNIYFLYDNSASYEVYFYFIVMLLGRRNGISSEVYGKGETGD